MWSPPVVRSRSTPQMVLTTLLLTGGCLENPSVGSSLETGLPEEANLDPKRGGTSGTTQTPVPVNAVESVKIQTNGLRFVNGLRKINGLRKLNGLRKINGLRVGNGLRLLNGFHNLTGLATREGRRRQTTRPDGILSRTEGLMRNEESRETAKYLVACALTSAQSILVEDYANAKVELHGAVGLAPEWMTGDCDKSCQEKVSACLMALTNGDAANVEIELAAPSIPRIGGEHSFPHYEVAFYGNLFLDEGEGYACLGEDNHIPRMSEGYKTDTPNVDGAEVFESPYYITGDCHKSADCTFDADTPMSCRDADGGVWDHVITTYRNLDGTNIIDQRDYWDWRCEQGDAAACEFEHIGWLLHLE